MRTQRNETLTLFNSFYRRQKAPLLHYAMGIMKDREVAEEIVSDAFMKTWDRLGEFESEENQAAFLYVVTRNACYNHKKSAEGRVIFDRDALDVLPYQTDVFLDLVDAELLDIVYAEIDKLPEKQRDVLRLSFIEGYTTKEIGERLGMTASTVFANRSLGLKRLRETLKGEHLLLLISFLQALYGGR